MFEISCNLKQSTLYGLAKLFILFLLFHNLSIHSCIYSWYIPIFLFTKLMLTHFPSWPRKGWESHDWAHPACPHLPSRLHLHPRGSQSSGCWMLQYRSHTFEPRKIFLIPESNFNNGVYKNMCRLLVVRDPIYIPNSYITRLCARQNALHSWLKVTLKVMV